MKKFKLISIVLAFIVFVTMPVVYAHEVELSSDIITIPTTSESAIWKGTKVQIASSYGEYNFYYQYVVITDEQYKNYIGIKEEQKKYEAEHKPVAGATKEEQNAYEEEMKNYEKSKEGILPSYDDKKWIASSDNTVPIDEEKNTEPAKYVLWVKVESKTGTDKNAKYNDLVVVYNPTTKSDDNSKSEEEANPSTSDNIILFAAGAALIAGVMVVSFKKSRA